MVSQELIERIRAAVNIVDVVSEHVSLRKSGSNYSGLCPFHSERSPSFNVQEAKQFYHCFGCKKSGDVFDFVKEMHGLNFGEAVEELADRARIALPKGPMGTGTGDPEAEKRREAAREKLSTAWRLNRFASVFYQKNLEKFKDAHSYVTQRGVGPDAIRGFFVGASLPGWDALTKHLIASKAPMPLAVELGLVSPSTKGAAGGPGYFDLFRNRAIFPIHDLRGKVVGFGGRSLPGEADADTGPKYLNSRESFVFKKSELAYGLFQAQKYVRESDEIIVVEGYFDVIALHSAGFQNVVATCGTSLTLKHLELFKRFASRIIILFDGDKAGIAATDKAMELGLSQGMVLHGASLPDGLDPDEILFQSGKLLPEGKERMSTILKSARPLIDTQIEAAGRQAAQSAEDRTLAIKRVANWLALFTDPVGKAVRLQEAEKVLGVSSEILDPRSAGRTRPAQPSRPPRASLPPPRTGTGSAARPVASPPLTTAEKILLAGLARGGKALEAAQQALSKMPPDTAFAEIFSHPGAQGVLQAAEKRGSLALGAEIFSGGPLGTRLDPQVQSTLTEAWMSTESPFSFQDFQVALDRALGRAWARFSHRIIAALKEAEAKKDAGLQSQLMKEYLDVQRRMKEFNTFPETD